MKLDELSFSVSLAYKIARIHATKRSNFTFRWGGQKKSSYGQIEIEAEHNPKIMTKGCWHQHPNHCSLPLFDEVD